MSTWVTLPVAELIKIVFFCNSSGKNVRKAAQRQSVCYLSFYNSSIYIFCLHTTTHFILFFHPVRCTVAMWWRTTLTSRHALQKQSLIIQATPVRGSTVAEEPRAVMEHQTCHQLLIKSHSWLENTGLTQTIAGLLSWWLCRKNSCWYMDACFWFCHLIPVPRYKQCFFCLSHFPFLCLIIEVLAVPANTFSWHPVYHIFPACVASVEVSPISYFHYYSPSYH